MPSMTTLPTRSASFHEIAVVMTSTTAKRAMASPTIFTLTICRVIWEDTTSCAYPLLRKSMMRSSMRGWPRQRSTATTFCQIIFQGFFLGESAGFSACGSVATTSTFLAGEVGRVFLTKNIRKLPIRAETRDEKQTAGSLPLRPMNNQEMPPFQPSPRLDRSYALAERRERAHQSDKVQKDVAECVTEHIANHEDAVEHVAIGRDVLVHAILGEENTLRRPRKLRIRTKTRRDREEDACDKAHYESKPGYQVCILQNVEPR